MLKRFLRPIIRSLISLAAEDEKPNKLAVRASKNKSKSAPGSSKSSNKKMDKIYLVVTPKTGLAAYTSEKRANKFADMYFKSTKHPAAVVEFLLDIDMELPEYEPEEENEDDDDETVTVDEDEEEEVVTVDEEEDDDE